MGLKKSKHQAYIVENVIPNIETIHRLEDLCNDLIYELFDYLSFHEISRAFGNLNNRFENLIDDYAHYVNMQQIHTRLLPRNIQSLKISAQYQMALIDLSTIGSLHALSLSNLRTMYLTHMIDTLSLKELKYVYLGACPIDNERRQQQLGEIQERILSLGQLKLQKCVFRMRFLGNIKQLPIQLPSINYLRIDGCENILDVNELLNRMPNLQSFYVSILGSIRLDDHYIERNKKHQHLTHVTIRLQSNVSFEQLCPLFDAHGSSIKDLTIYLESMREGLHNHQQYDQYLLHLYSRITTIINQSLPRLIIFRLRQHVLSQKYNFLLQTCTTSPYVEEIPSSFEHSSYLICIPRHLVDLWQKRN